MYAWGGDTKDWKGKSKYDFDSARKPYLDKLAADAASKGPRSYSARIDADLKLVDPRGKEISSNSENPLVIAVDVTGSMAAWPGEIFDRLPLLYQTLSQYRKDLEISFVAIGDATCDTYPLQVNDFAKDLALEDKLKALCPEGRGGGHITESYELFAYFLTEHAKIENAKSPFLLIYGDEAFYDKVDPVQVRNYIGDNLEAQLDSKDVWNKLMQKFNVYFLQKPYGTGHDTRTTEEINGIWAGALGKQRIIEVPSPERAVDIGIGLIAKQWGEYGDFTKSLSARHDDKDAALVHKSLRFLDSKKSVASVVSGKAVRKSLKLLDK